jgi:hypothetical protein
VHPDLTLSLHDRKVVFCLGDPLSGARLHRAPSHGRESLA